MEELFNDAISQQVKSAIDKSQKELKTDYLGFDKAFQKYHAEAIKYLPNYSY
ncbi:Ger(x)C family spore germination C-terminal domain-containing protein [Desulfosporosinus sp. BICA1-9]|uniref:Ger(x)C family spore germination C-terminal domain-containing protein n=1 Tax=Desulfosporosinus sp. BICA1-9 TaxID=1531958 RepID=UPI000A827069|nr:hypothetical protein [Desulfosporosinus sp.]